MEKLDIVLDKIEKICNPQSIFLYGSRARSDFKGDSDYEIGVLMRDRDYVGRSAIEKEIDDKNFSVYPFRCEDFMEGNIDTPFQKTLYLYELISVGKTLRGSSIIEEMDLPPIMVLDLMQRIRFDIGFALGAVMSYRNGDSKTASLEFCKSCLFGLRTLEILELKKFGFTYQDIYDFSKDMDLGEYGEMVSSAYHLRTQGGVCEGKDLFKNISFLNRFVESRIMERFRRDGNVRLM